MNVERVMRIRTHSEAHFLRDARETAALEFAIEEEDETTSGEIDFE